MKTDSAEPADVHRRHFERATQHLCRFRAGGADCRGQFALRLSVIAASLTETDMDRLSAAVLGAWRGVQSVSRAR